MGQLIVIRLPFSYPYGLERISAYMNCSCFLPCPLYIKSAMWGSKLPWQAGDGARRQCLACRTRALEISGSFLHPRTRCLVFSFFLSVCPHSGPIWPQLFPNPIHLGSLSSTAPHSSSVKSPLDVIISALKPARSSFLSMCVCVCVCVFFSPFCE